MAVARDGLVSTALRISTVRSSSALRRFSSRISLADAVVVPLVSLRCHSTRALHTVCAAVALTSLAKFRCTISSRMAPDRADLIPARMLFTVRGDGKLLQHAPITPSLRLAGAPAVLVVTSADEPATNRR